MFTIIIMYYLQYEKWQQRQWFYFIVYSIIIISCWLLQYNFLSEYTIIPPIPNVSLSLSVCVRIWWMDIDACAQQALQVSTVSGTWTSAPVDPVSTAGAARTLSADSSVCVHLVSQVPRVRWAPKPLLLIHDWL